MASPGVNQRPFHLEIREEGDWKRTLKKFQLAPAAFRLRQRQLLRREAEFFRKHIVEGIKKQAPGGKPWKKLSDWTIATRRYLGIGGRKALIEHGDLIKGIKVYKWGTQDFIVGVPPGAVNSAGVSLLKISRIQEFGSISIIPLTPGMMKFFMMILEKLGQKKQRQLKKAPKTGGVFGHVMVTVPARPFIAPVFEKFGAPGMVNDRMKLRIAEMAELLFWKT